MTTPPIKAECEKCKAQVWLVKMVSGATVPIVSPRFKILIHAVDGWVEGPEGYAPHICPKEAKPDGAKT